jgi:hypothetical protein
MQSPRLAAGAGERNQSAWQRSESSPPVPNNQVDPRLALLERLSARCILVEAGQMSLDDAFDESILEAFDDSFPCRCRWERLTSPFSFEEVRQ